MENEDASAKTRSFPQFLRKILLGIGAFVFLFGDKFLQEICHMDFLTSILIWIGSLGVFVVAGVILSNFCDD